MAHLHGAAVPQGEGHGLRFTNEEWNGTIANDDVFNLKWNMSVDVKNSVLGLFQVTYPKDGVKAYELVSNLTDNIHSESCRWTPDNLEDKLYEFWLKTGTEGNQSWAISPPWKLRTARRGFHWAAPVGIPIVIIIGLYVTGLLICLSHRRRRRRKLAQKQASREATRAANNSHPSVISVSTAATRVLNNENTPGSKLGVKKRGEAVPPVPPVLLSRNPAQRQGSASTTMSGSTWIEDVSRPGSAKAGKQGCKDRKWSDNVYFDGTRFDSRSRTDSVRSDDVRPGGLPVDRGRPRSISVDGILYALPGTAM